MYICDTPINKNMKRNLLNEEWVKILSSSDEWNDLVKRYNEFEKLKGYSGICLSEKDVERLYDKCGRPEDDNAYDELDAIEQFIGDLGAIFKKTVDNNVECWSCEGLRIQITKE